MLRRLVKAWARLSPSRGVAAALNAEIHPDAVLYDTARIANNLGRHEAIRVGAHSHIRGELLTFSHGGAIEIGDYCYVGEQTRLWSAGRISVGHRTLISHQVTILDNLTHPLNPAARHAQFRAIITAGHPRDLDLGERPVVIGEDVLIGCASVILPGVTIGRAAVIGAGSVVTKDVPPYTIVAGNPAVTIRELTADER
jgi:acetyltransferase-like isoleucine patch superfamily enzyme